MLLFSQLNLIIESSFRVSYFFLFRKKWNDEGWDRPVARSKDSFLKEDPTSNRFHFQILL